MQTSVVKFVGLTTSVMTILSIRTIQWYVDMVFVFVHQILTMTLMKTNAIQTDVNPVPSVRCVHRISIVSENLMAVTARTQNGMRRVLNVLSVRVIKVVVGSSFGIPSPL